MRAFAEEGRLSGTTDIPPLLETADAIQHHIVTQTVLVATMDSQVVGAVRGLLDGAVCTIRGLIVEPDLQGRGIGAALLTAIEAAHEHVDRFDLTTNTLVPGNVSFYERRGYRTREVIRPIYDIPVANMTKDAM